MTHRVKCLCVAALVLAAAPVSAAPVHWRFTTGFDYSSGRYDNAVSTNVLLVPLTAKAYVGNWTFRIGTNLLDIHGPANVTVTDSGNGGVDPTGGTPATGNRNGFGDTTVGANYTATHVFDTALYADIGARLRLPTGNYAQGLGSGTVDEIVNLELGGNWNTFGGYVSAGRRFLGDSHGFTRKDGYQFGVGGWVTVERYTELGAYYEYRNAVTTTLPDPKVLGVYAAYRLAQQWKVQLDLGKGLSSGSATNDIGLYLTYRPDGGYR